MNSLDLRDVIYPPFDREASDELMLRILKWVQAAVPPEYCFTPQQLGEWAMRNGWRQDGNDAELCALLRRTQEYVWATSPLSREITDALYARRSLYG
jgi:hypothetical protein